MTDESEPYAQGPRENALLMARLRAFFDPYGEQSTEDNPNLLIPEGGIFYHVFC